MNGKISDVGITLSVISFLISTFLPTGIMVFLAVKKRLNWKAVAFGVILFVVFTAILESMLNSIVGFDNQNSFINQSPILFMLYGGLSIGIFEETARFIGFKYMLKIKDNESAYTGISYGLGHGGFESVMAGGVTSLSNLMMSIMINNGAVNDLLAKSDAGKADTIKKSVNEMLTLPDYTFLLIGVERCATLIIQVSLSLIVFKAVKEKKWNYFIYAIIIHSVVYFPALLSQKDIFTNTAIGEMIFVFFAAAIALYAYKICWLPEVKNQK